MAKVLSLVAFAVLASAVAGQENDPVRAKLDKATADYAVAVEKVKEMAEKTFTTAEDKARGQADSKRLDQLGRSRKAFDRWLELPEEAAFEPVRGKLNQARRAVTAAHKAAIKEYVAAKQTARADALVKDLNQLQEGWDGLKPGSVWRGQHKWLVEGAAKVKSSEATMTVADRQGPAVSLKVEFEVDDKPKTMRVDGKVEYGRFVGVNKSNTIAVRGRVVGDHLTLATERPATLEKKAMVGSLDVKLKRSETK